MKRWRCEFNGREIGAIGIFYRIVKTVEALDIEAAKLECYKTHEHINFVYIAEINSDG